MPFVSKDWRDPGEQWVKTDDGWEKTKVVNQEVCVFDIEDDDNRIEDDENQENSPPDKIAIIQDRRGSIRRDSIRRDSFHRDSFRKDRRDSIRRDSIRRDSLRRDSEEDDLGSSNRELLIVQPYCHIYTRNTKEVAGFNGLGETLRKLDFINAVRDNRRFRYICKLLDLLITQKLPVLSGGAQKMLFGMLEEVALEVSQSQQNMHMLHSLLEELRKHLHDYLWGSKLGSTILWEQHQQRLKGINTIFTNIKIQQPGDDSHPTLQEIPEECVREILRRLDNHKDIESAGKAYSVMAKVSEENAIWKQLCSFHWTPHQIEHIIRLHKELEVKRNWQQVFDKLRKAYGLKEVYPENIHLCRNCSCMYWQSFGHPCRTDNIVLSEERLEEGPALINDENMKPEVEYIIITPQEFLKYFHL